MKFGRLRKMPEAAYQYFESPSVNQENRNPKFKIFWREDAFTQREDAFTQSDLVSTKDEQAQELILQIRKFFFIFNQESLANQLITLFNFAKEERPTSPGISVKSLSNFYDFLKLNTNIRTPNLSLSPDRNIYASWRVEKRVFSAHFLPEGDIRFVLFKPNKRHPKRKIRVTGIATSDTLMEIIAPENLSDWVLYEG